MEFLLIPSLLRVGSSTYAGGLVIPAADRLTRAFSPVELAVTVTINPVFTSVPEDWPMLRARAAAANFYANNFA